MQRLWISGEVLSREVLKIIGCLASFIALVRIWFESSLRIWFNVMSLNNDFISDQIAISLIIQGKI